MRYARAIVLALAVAPYACTLQDGGILGEDATDGSVQDTSIADGTSGDENVLFDDGGDDGAACAVACPSGFTCTSGTCVDNAARAFVANTNPTGNWLYFHLTLDAGRIPYPSQWAPDDSGLVIWSPAVGTGTPLVGENVTGVVAHPFGTTNYPPHSLAAHPDSDGSWSVVRWTAPANGNYTVHLHATGASYDAHPTTTDVRVFKNGVLVGAGYVNVDGGTNDAIFPPAASAFNAADTLDVRVGYGNGDYTYDSTTLDLLITTP